MNATDQRDEGTMVLQTDRGPIDVDASIAPIVDALNRAGVSTIASCSGHGHRPGNIALRDGREIIITRDFKEARMIDRLFPIASNGERLAALRVAPKDGPMTMVEKIARELMRAGGLHPAVIRDAFAKQTGMMSAYEATALIVIDTLKEPTDPMWRAADAKTHAWGGNGGLATPGEIWSAMLGAADD